MLGKRAETDLYDQRIHRQWSSVFLEVCCDKTIFFVVGFFHDDCKILKERPREVVRPLPSEVFQI